MNKNQLSIRLYGEPVGVLEQLTNGKKIFSYQSNALMPISNSMPIREQPYEDKACDAYFGGLLPESDTARRLIGKRYGVSPYNNFALLRAIGHDCAGAISCHPIDAPIVPQNSIPFTGKIITDAKLYEHIKNLPQNPLFIDIEGFRLSLAGVQDKAAVCYFNNQILIPENDSPTTHILKPSSHHFEGIAENEYFILKIANRIGLPVPQVTLKKIKDITFLLVERYDRNIKDNIIQRIHQEDFCQALGVLTARKYQNEGGPSLKNCFDILNNTTHPAVARNHLVSAVIFNYLIGNMDAHGKNFSLLHHPSSDMQLSPFYDMVCTRVYPRLTDKMAMKIGGKYAADEILLKHWKEFCEDINYRYIVLEDSIKILGQKIIEALTQESQAMQEGGTHHPIIDKIANFIEVNIKKTISRYHFD